MLNVGWSPPATVIGLDRSPQYNVLVLPVRLSLTKNTLSEPQPVDVACANWMIAALLVIDPVVEVPNVPAVLFVTVTLAYPLVVGSPVIVPSAATLVARPTYTVVGLVYAVPLPWSVFRNAFFK